MYSANAYLIRDARVEDVPELVRLGWANAESWRSGQILSVRSDGSLPPRSRSTRTGA